MDTIAFVLLVVAALNLALAGVVLRAGMGKETNRVFAAAAVAVALWTCTNAGFRLAATERAANVMAALAYGAAVVLGAAFLHFALIYPERRRTEGPKASYGWVKTAAWIIALVIAVLAFVPGFMVRDIDVESRRIVTAPGVYGVALYMLATAGLAFGLFFTNQRRLRGHRQTQARYVLFGSFLTAICGLAFNLFLPLMGDYRFVWLGPVSSLFFVGFTVYSIVAHRLFDVRVLIRHTLAYSLVLALMAGAFAALEKGIEHLVRPMLGPGDAFPTDLLAALLVGFGVEPLRQWAKAVAHRLLFKDEPVAADDD